MQIGPYFSPASSPPGASSLRASPNPSPCPPGPRKQVLVSLPTPAQPWTPPPATLHFSRAPTGLLRRPPSGHSTFPNRLPSSPPPSLQVAQHLSQPSDGCPNFGPSKQGGVSFLPLNGCPKFQCLPAWALPSCPLARGHSSSPRPMPRPHGRGHHSWMAAQQTPECHPES